jgi:outer membrane lipoprotein SlyB
MKTTRIFTAALIASGAILGGCASTSQPYDSGYAYNSRYDSRYDNRHDNRASMGYGTIESIQVVRGDGRTSGGGAIVGGLVGALAGNQIGSGGGRTAATVAGGVAGAAIGNNVEANRNANGRDYYQINVRLDNGEYRTVTQDSVYDLHTGDRIRLVDGRAYRY